jgi:hypothetical protein
MIILDLFTVEEKLEEMRNLSAPFPNNEVLRELMQSVDWHLQPEIPENIQKYALRVQQEILTFSYEPLLFIEAMIQ